MDTRGGAGGSSSSFSGRAHSMVGRTYPDDLIKEKACSEVAAEEEEDK